MIASCVLLVSLDIKSTKEKNRRLVKINWLECMQALAELMGAFKKTADYGTINGKSASYQASEQKKNTNR